MMMSCSVLKHAYELLKSHLLETNLKACLKNLKALNDIYYTCICFIEQMSRLVFTFFSSTIYETIRILQLFNR